MDYIDRLLSDFVMINKSLVDEVKRNSVSVSTDMAGGSSLALLLQHHLLKWRPWDFRIYLQHFDDRFHNYPTELTTKLYDHLKVSVLGIEDGPGYSDLEIGIFLNGEMESFDAYQEAVSLSLDSEVSFDPVTGTLSGGGHTRHGGTAAYLDAPSPHRVQSPVTNADDVIDLPLPEVDWNLRAVWRLRIKVIRDVFHITSEVVVPGVRTLQKSDIMGDDLSSLTMQLNQHVFGNAFEFSYEGDFGDGLRQLLAGEKAEGYKLSSRPWWDIRKSPVFWARLVDVLMFISIASMILGPAYLGYGWYEYGWDLSLRRYLIAGGLLAGGSFMASVIIPFATAFYDESLIKSLK